MLLTSNRDGSDAPSPTTPGEADVLDAVQMTGRHQVHVDRSRDALLTDFGRATLSDRYLMPGEGFQDLFARVASYYGDDAAHAQRLYDYISKLWFMPATPVLSNGGTNRGLPISCFLNEASDSLDGIVGLWNENVWLASKGGGIGSYWSNLRSIGEKVGAVGKTSGVIPFIRVMDSLTLAISQGSLRRGSAAVYLPVWHPEIEEFIEIRRPTGGDPNRKAQLKTADDDRDALDGHVSVREGHRQERRHHQRHRRRNWNAHHAADARQAGKLGEQSAEAGQDQRRHRDPGPSAPEMLLDQFRMALARHRAKPHRQFLDDVKDRDEHDLQQEQAVAPLGAALRRSDDAARVRVRQHDDDAGSGDDEEPSPVE